MTKHAKMTPNGFVAICQCDNTVGAMHLTGMDNADAGKLLGKWLYGGCTVEPRFGERWSETIKPCACDDSKQSSEVTP